MYEEGKEGEGREGVSKKKRRKEQETGRETEKIKGTIMTERSAKKGEGKVE